MFRGPTREAAAAAVQARWLGRGCGETSRAPGAAPDADQVDPESPRPWLISRARGRGRSSGRAGRGRLCQARLSPTAKATEDLLQVWIPPALLQVFACFLINFTGVLGFLIWREAGKWLGGGGFKCKGQSFNLQHSDAWEESR